MTFQELIDKINNSLSFCSSEIIRSSSYNNQYKVAVNFSAYSKTIPGVFTEEELKSKKVDELDILLFCSDLSDDNRLKYKLSESEYESLTLFFHDILKEISSS